jgi:chromate transport protein ChrA
MTLTREKYMRVLTAIIVTVCAAVIALYAYLNRFTTILLITLMGILVWLIHYFIYPWYTKQKPQRGNNGDRLNQNQPNAFHFV